MSKFLAPIHYWLFNKIKLSEDLEKDLKEFYLESFGEEIRTIYFNIENNIGKLTEDLPLEQIIDTSNIHGWLQNKISLTEKRTAALITEAMNNFGDKAFELAIKAFNEQGYRCGLHAKVNYSVNTAPELYKALNNYILEGMPCDNVSSISTQCDDGVEWKGVKCLHKAHWNEVNGNVEVFYILRKGWVDNFIKAANNCFIYSNYVEETMDSKIFIHKITKL